MIISAFFLRLPGHVVLLQECIQAGCPVSFVLCRGRGSTNLPDISLDTLIHPFRAAVPFWGQTIGKLSGSKTGLRF